MRGMDSAHEQGEKGLIDATLQKCSPRFPRNRSSLASQLGRYEAEIGMLQGQIKTIEGASESSLHNLEDTINRYQVLKRQYAQTCHQLENENKQKETLTAALEDAKNQIMELKEEIAKLCATPNSYGTYRKTNEDGTIDVSINGRTLKVNIHPKVEAKTLQEGQLVTLSETYNVIDTAGYEVKGEVVRIKGFLDEHRAIVVGRADEEMVVQLSEPLKRQGAKIGDHVLHELRSGYALERLPKSDVGEVALEEVPNVTYDDIGGLGPQIEALCDAIELPYLHPEEFREHRLSPPRGILLYGPPGCGKTLIAKAVANGLAEKIEKRTGQKTTAYFLNVKGPELLNKYVGETEYKIREVFKRAKEKAKEDQPVVVFFDEMDAIFRMRGSGVSSDVETTVVAQFLTEIDGLEALRNVIVIGASNRQDLIDPAVLRPGRLDLKIRVDRPDKEAACDIFSKYLTPDLPCHQSELERFSGDKQRAMQALIARAVELMYAPTERNQFLEVTYARGDQEILYFKDFASGAMIESIVSRAKRIALKRYLAGGQKGLCFQDLQGAIESEYTENEALANITNPDDWGRISGCKSDKIINMRTRLGGMSPKSRSLEETSRAQYL
jgi:proteasome-associated ATPase